MNYDFFNIMKKLQEIISMEIFVLPPCVETPLSQESVQFTLLTPESAVPPLISVFSTLEPAPAPAPWRRRWRGLINPWKMEKTYLVTEQSSSGDRVY